MAEESARPKPDLSPGKLVFYQMEGYPMWPCRVVSWDRLDQSDPAQLALPPAMVEDCEDPEKTKAEVMFVYLGPAVDFGFDRRESPKLLAWEVLRDDLKKVVDRGDKDKELWLLRLKYANDRYFPDMSATDTSDLRIYEYSV